MTTGTAEVHTLHLPDGECAEWLTSRARPAIQALHLDGPCAGLTLPADPQYPWMTVAHARGGPVEHQHFALEEGPPAADGSLTWRVAITGHEPNGVA